MVALNKELFPGFQKATKETLTKFVPDPDQCVCPLYTLFGLIYAFLNSTVITRNKFEKRMQIADDFYTLNIYEMIFTRSHSLHTNHSLLFAHSQ